MERFISLTRIIGAAVLAVSLAGNVGCSMSKWKPSKIFSLDSTWPFHDKGEPREGTPVRVVGTWTDTVMTKAAEKPQRGFGGRLLFYEKDEKDPIKVDGQLIVYAFDETDRDPTDNKPTRRYVFPAEQLPLHMSKSELGASYSFWLPWDEAPGTETKVSLICRFEPKGGAVVTSEQTAHQLPGAPRVAGAKGTKKPPKVPEGVPSKPQIQTLEGLQSKRAEERTAQLASYETTVPISSQPGASVAAQDANTLSNRHMTSTTINLPNDYQMPSAQNMLNQSQTNSATSSGILTNRQQTVPAQQFFQQSAPPTTVPNTPTINTQLPIQGQATTGFSATTIPQTPMIQAQSQQTALQQQMLLQQQLQQQAFQQRMMPNQLPVQTATVQMPVLPDSTPVARTPAVVQYR